MTPSKSKHSQFERDLVREDIVNAPGELMETVENSHRITYAIEHLCGGGAGCPVHPPGTWRVADKLGEISTDYAWSLYERRCRAYPNSTYRLVEHVVIRRETREVLEP